MQITTHPPAAQPSGELQDSINRRIYQTPGVERIYWKSTLTASETAALLAYQPGIAGKDILDVGVGTARTTRFLAPLAARYVGIDYSAPMVEAAHKQFPGADFRLHDMRELAALGARSFDCVFAPNCVIDAASEEGREQFLAGAFAVLRPAGLLIFSSHNLRHAPAFEGPRLEASRNPVRFARNLQQYARQMRNHRRVGRFRRIEADHAILNDCGHDYSLLHYYIDRDGSESQLVRVGFELLTIFDDFGTALGIDEYGEGSASLMYVARRNLT